MESLGLGPDQLGQNFSQIRISGDARVHLGNNYNFSLCIIYLDAYAVI